MSDTQTPTPNPETPATETPSIGVHDLKLLLEAEKLKRESAEKKVTDLEAKLQETQSNVVSLTEESHKERNRIGKLIEIAQAECAAAVKNTRELEAKFKETSDASYQTYLAAWSESKIGKVSLPKDKTNTPELIAIALAAFDVARGHLSGRKEFQTALTAKLGL